MTSDSDPLDMSGNVTLKRDKKARDMWLITTTDSEGFHRQLPITFDDMRELVAQLARGQRQGSQGQAGHLQQPRVEGVAHCQTQEH